MTKFMSNFLRKAKKVEDTMNPYEEPDKGQRNKAFEDDVELTGL